MPSASAFAKRIDEIWGWAKELGGLRRSRFRGVKKLQWASYLVGAAYNLARLAGMLRCLNPRAAAAA